MSYPAISLATATVGRHRCPQKRLQTARQPPVYPNSSPDHRACNSLTPSAVLTPSIPVHRWIRDYTNAPVAGPLATFSGAHSWVEHPYREGVALIGDSAATSDPTHGQGLSKTVRDARVLRDKLIAHEDWSEAGHAYAEEHDRYYAINHTLESWVTQMLYETGPEADALRAKALPTRPGDPTRQLEPFYSGPDQPLDEAARRQFFGEK